MVPPSSLSWSSPRQDNHCLAPILPKGKKAKKEPSQIVLPQVKADEREPQPSHREASRLLPGLRNPPPSKQGPGTRSPTTKMSLQGQPSTRALSGKVKGLVQEATFKECQRHPISWAPLLISGKCQNPCLKTQFPLRTLIRSLGTCFTPVPHSD